MWSPTKYKNMPICAVITSGYAVSCTTPLVPGTEDDILLANKSEVEGYTVDGANPMLVTAIDMAVGTQFYRFEGQNMSVEPKSRLVLTRYSRLYEHEARFKIFANAAADKLQIDKLIKGEVVALSKSKAGSWELFGKDIGLKVTEMERDPNNTDTGGAYDLLLKTPDTAAKETFLPATFFDTDAATTEAAILVLLAPAPL
jgi:hypothetical protein